MASRRYIVHVLDRTSLVSRTDGLSGLNSVGLKLAKLIWRAYLSSEGANCFGEARADGIQRESLEALGLPEVLDG